MKEINQSDGGEGDTTYLARCAFDSKQGKFYWTDELRKESAIFKNELVFYVLEFKEKEMLVALESATLLLLKAWKMVRVFTDTNPNNDFWRKGYLSPLPGFDTDDFPFIACSGSRGINLVNLSQSTI